MELAFAEGLGLGALLAVCLMLAAGLMLAVLSGLRDRRDSSLVGRLAHRRGKRLAETMRMLAMAEDLAQLGIWQYRPDTQEHEWSHGMKALLGLEPQDELLAGDAETLLASNHIDLVSTAMSQGSRQGTFAMRFLIAGVDGTIRNIKMQACHLRNRHGGTERVVGVMIDQTDVARREQKLKESREQALVEARQARELAETDPLTGLANRRRVMSRLDRLVMAAHGNGEPLAMIVFDIDHFKQVNDTFGHPEGDKVLRQIAAVAREQAREGDVIGRIGGEEFAWIVPGADLSFAKLVAERLRLAIAVDGATGAVPTITVSIGIAALVTGDASLSLFARADAALYDAKHAGRNTIRLAA